MSKFSVAVSAIKTFAKSPISNPTTGKLILATNRVAPNLMVYSGVVGMVGATVIACNKIFESHHIHATATSERIRMKKFVENNPDTEEALTYNRDLTRSYIQEGCKHVRVMAPALTLSAISIGLILGGHNLLRKRHTALVSAYAVLQNSYDEYRGAVTEALGADVERELRVGLAEENKRMGSDGVERYTASMYSPYAKFFDEGNTNYVEGDTTWNLHFLRMTQSHFNDKLRLNGYVFLNDVYRALGFPTTKAGQLVGWTIYGGDNFINFGVWDENNKAAIEFVNGFEKGIWLDFNVEGNIIDKLNIGEF